MPQEFCAIYALCPNNEYECVYDGTLEIAPKYIKEMIILSADCGEYPDSAFLHIWVKDGILSWLGYKKKYF